MFVFFMIVVLLMQLLYVKIGLNKIYPQFNIIKSTSQKFQLFEQVKPQLLII